MKEFMRSVPSEWSVGVGWDYYMPHVARRAYVFQLRNVLAEPGLIDLALVRDDQPQAALQREALLQAGFHLSFQDGPHTAYESPRHGLSGPAIRADSLRIRNSNR